MATDNKYDRQLRLWGSDGQKRLSEAHLLLLNSGPTGTETLKNLVLPGIGKFTIVDGSKVSKSDISNNFFVTEDCIGKDRAQVCCELLNELNSDVKGNFVVSDPLEYMRSSNLESFSIVLVTGMIEKDMLEIESICGKLNLPVVVARSLGFIGHLRLLSSGSHCIIETKPSPKPADDIRIANPFPELLKFSADIDLEKLDDKDYKHVPYVVVLIKVMQKWKDSHNGEVPKTTKEKNEFRELIKSLTRKSWGEEENFEEALQSAYQVFATRTIPYTVQEILENPQCKTGVCVTPGNEYNEKFWILARALKEFVESKEEGNGMLPLSGVLPDMTSSTNFFVDLQNIYQAKAHHDCQCIGKRVEAILNQLSKPIDFISKEELTRFCKNTYDLQTVSFTKLCEEVDGSTMNKENVEDAIAMGELADNDQYPFYFYLVYRAVDRFHEKHSRYPGDNGKMELDENDKDKDELVLILQEIKTELGLPAQVNVNTDHVKEFVRYGGCELHNIASVVGGIASQEIVKLITHQYTPLDNTYIFNGITCTGAVYKF